MPGTPERSAIEQASPQLSAAEPITRAAATPKPPVPESPTTVQQDELERLRARVAALERENAEMAARANAAIAAAQEKAYWLDRWGLDLNALMRRRGASELRAALRGVRLVYRAARYGVVKPLVARLRG